MNPLFWPPVNYAVRHLMRPLAPWLHYDYHPRITGEFTVQVAPQTRIRLATNPTSFMAKRLFFEGAAAYEWGSMRCFLSLVQSAQTFCDVGSNLGYYAVVATAHNPDVQVHAFEPLPGAFHYLRRNIRLNGADHQIAAHPVALSDTAGTETFHVAIDPTFAHLDHHLTATAGFNKTLSSRTPLTRSFEVQTQTLDQYARAHLNRPIDLLKIDTEASEHRVLWGGQDVLRTDRPVIFCEVLPGRIEDELEQIFSAANYQCYRACPASLQPVQALAPEDDSEREYLMVPREKRDDVEAHLAQAAPCAPERD